MRLTSLLALLVLSACSAGTYESPGDIPFHPGESHFGLGLGTSGPGSMFVKGAVPMALDRIRSNRYGRQDLPLAEVTLYDTYLAATVQGTADPSDRDHVRVDIDGAVKTTPVQGGSKDRAELFDASDVAWDQVPAMATAAVAALHLDHGVVSQATVSRSRLGVRTLSFTFHCSNARHSGLVVYDARGKQLSVNSQ